MKSKLVQAWYAVRYSLWFVPGLMTALAALLAFGSMRADDLLAQSDLLDFWWLYSGDPEGARALLSTIAGSMITVAGLVFSLTMVVLSLTSSQFGPRLVRNFMDDTGNQLVLGTFVATFVYCLMVLRSVEGGPAAKAGAAHLSVTLGMGLALVSLAVLIYFIHHIASSIQANNLMARVGRTLEQTIDRLYPQALEEGEGQANNPQPVVLPDGFEMRAAELWAHKSGYLKMIDQESLLHTATDHNLLVKVICRPGGFLVRGEPLALVWPAESMEPSLAVGLHDAFNLGAERNESQDPVFPAQLLAETALRALSPGINDPFTAVTCIDWLTSGLARLAGRFIPAAGLYDEAGEVRVVLRPVTMQTIIEQAVDPVRGAARQSEICTIRLLEAVGALARQVERLDDLAALEELTRRIKEDSLEHIHSSWDRQAVTRGHEQTQRLLEQAGLRCAARAGQ